MEYARRSPPYKELQLQHNRCEELMGLRMMGRLKGQLDCRPTVNIMKHFCNLPHGGPDYLIFDSERPEGLVGAWKFEEGPPAAHTTYYLYDCSKLH